MDETEYSVTVVVEVDAVFVVVDGLIVVEVVLVLVEPVALVEPVDNARQYNNTMSIGQFRAQG